MFVLQLLLTSLLQFFDDNIHNSAEASIVVARRRATAADAFVPVDGGEAIALQGVHLVRVQTAEAVLQWDYFLEHIERCEAALKAKRRGE